MADGTYERRGPREAELKRLRRILADCAAARKAAASGTHPSSTSEKSLPRRAAGG